MRLLFVDDEPQVLRGLQRMLDAAELEWDTEFVCDGPLALAAMKQHKFDAIVSDMRMPGMDGAQLLAEVSHQYPEVIRIIFSGQADRQSVFRAVNPMHQYVAKPCDAETLKQVLTRACALRRALDCDGLQQLVGGITSLPSVPALYTQLTEILQTDDATIDEIGEIIAHDAGMTAKLLKLANSAIFGLNRSVSSPAEAASLLGIDTIQALVLSAGVFMKCEGVSIKDFSLDATFQHSLEVARFSSHIAKSEGLDQDSVKNAFTAGMLHDVGKLVLATNRSTQYEQAIAESRQSRVPLWKVEHDMFGASHAAIGGHLLRIWGLPQSIVEIVALHHSPCEAQDSQISPLTAVWFGNLLSNNRTQPLDQLVDHETLRPLTELGCADRVSQWETLCQKRRGER